MTDQCVHPDQPPLTTPTAIALDAHYPEEEFHKAFLAIEAEAALLARPRPATDVSAPRPTRDPVDADYAALERLARAATPGPWHSTRYGRVCRDPGPDAYGFVLCDALEDAAYIAAASPDVVLALLARRAPGDRDWRQLLDNLVTTLTAGVPPHGRLADDLDEARRALAADSRPEQAEP